MDADWIEIIMDNDDNLTGDWITSVRKYWRGEKASATPTWETIVSGCVTTWGSEIKLRAQSEIEEYFPDSQLAWEYSELCCDVGSLDGINYPILIADDQGLTIKERFFFKDGEEESFKEQLQHGIIGRSKRLRKFSSFKHIQWPNLDISQRRIPLSELQIILDEINTTEI